MSYYIPSNPIAPSRLLSGQTPTKRMVDLLFEHNYLLTEKLRRLPLLIYLRLGLPIAKIFPWQLIVLGKNLQSNQTGYLIDWAKVTGRVVTSIGHEGGASFYVRHSTGQAANETEKRLLDYLSNQPFVSDFVQPPEFTKKIAGVVSTSYRFAHGSVIPQEKNAMYAIQIRQFLCALSKINPPEYLEPAEARLGRYLSRWLLHYQNKPKEDFLLQAQSALERLHNQNAFRWIIHGELRCGNIRILSQTKQLNIVDWVQCYKGHPLLDWWMFTYWERAPRIDCLIPEELTMGLDKKAIGDLWLVWKAAYNR